MKFGSNKGFSLIEVMVATTILMIIVIMVGNIFRHSSNAWETGYSAAEGASGIRSVLGTIHRELSQAIDGREYGLSAPIDVGSSYIKFYRYAEPIKKGSEERELQFIEYDFSENNVVRKQDGKSVTLYSKQTSVGGNSEVMVSFDVVEPDPISNDNLNVNESFEGEIWSYPFITIKASIVRKSSFAGMEARSYGPDGKRNTEDDIIAR